MKRISAHSPAALLQRSLESLTGDGSGELSPGNYRIAILGIGNELRGDDGAGRAVARQLLPLAGKNPRVLVLDAGPAPENFTGVLRRFNPHCVLFVDAAQFNGHPGETRLFASKEFGDIDSSTHALSIGMLADYLDSELGCKQALIGIQPADNSLKEELSPAVKESTEKIVQILTTIIRLYEEND